jgi:hypothetical protein
MERSNLENIDEKRMSFKKLRKETRRDFVTQQEPFAGQPEMIVVHFGIVFINQLLDGCAVI